MKASSAHVISVAFASLLLAFIISAGLGFAALNVMPCSWFGSTFEGACGYAAASFVLIAGLLLTVLLATSFVFMYLRRAKSTDAR